MTIADFAYQEGTIKSPQHTKSSSAAWVETDHVHFPDGKMTRLPPYKVESFTFGSTAFRGKKRSQWATRLGSNVGTYTLFGTHSHLYVLYKGVMTNITPFASQKHERLGTNPLALVNGDATMTVTWTAHGLAVGDYVTLSGATHVTAGYADTYINIQHKVTVIVDTDHFEVEIGATTHPTDATEGGTIVSAYSISPTDTLPNNPLSVTNTLKTVSVTYTAHGLLAGDRIKLVGATATGGIPAADFNKEHIITSITDANTFVITVSTAATSTTAGGGAVVDIFTSIAPGIDVQNLARGVGAGIVGAGIVGAGQYSTSAQQYPRIWSFDDLGDVVVMTPGDATAGDGQKIYVWDGDTSVAPTVAENAPTNCGWLIVLNNSVVALCDRTVKIGAQGGINYTATSENPTWSGYEYTQIDVQRAARLSTAAKRNAKEAVLFAPHALVLNYTGGEWDMRELEQPYAIGAAMAHCSYHEAVVWWGQDGNFYLFNGGVVETVVNRQNGEWIRDNLNYGKIGHSFMFQDQKHDQVYLYAAIGTDTEPGDYVIWRRSEKGDSFTLGTMERTSAQRPYAIDNTFYMTDDDDQLWRHFINSDEEIPWSAKSALFFVGDGSSRVRMDRAIFDLYTTASVTCAWRGREYPQSDDYSRGNSTLSESQRQVTPTVAGRLLGMELSGTQDFTLIGAKLDVKQMGGRI